MPLPSFSWANGAEVWNCMLEKDSAYSKLRNEKMLDRHPSLVHSYRTILFDWLSEVSHECKFHRETYHLALDFIDRYLSAQSNVGKLQLQLIGTTCLFLASKFEEIRPPTVNEFADLTDGACKAEDILENEVVILSAINWEITPITPNNWLSVYMQILLNLDREDKKAALKEDLSENLSNENNSNTTTTTTTTTANTISSTKNDTFILPAINGIFESKFKRIASVIDLALLHIDSLRFSNSILTAAALYHFTDELTVRKCAGYEYKEIATCVQWLTPFIETIEDIREPIFMLNRDLSIQMHTHIANAILLEKVLTKMRIRTKRKREIENETNQKAFKRQQTTSLQFSVQLTV